MAVGWVPERSSNASGYGSGLAAVLLATAVACGCTPDVDPDRSVAPDRAIVATVVDGDTIELLFGARRERVRLLGIDAPESVHPSVPVQCFGREASAELATLLPPGEEVRLVRDDQARDRYGRLLLYVYRAADELFVNRWLVRNGLADVASYEPNTALAPALSTARNLARAEGAGLWGRCDGPDQPLQ